MAARMNDAEAIMWAVESDPFLRTDFTNITVLASAPDTEQLRAGLERAIDAFPPLRQRVARPPLGLAPPQWAAARHRAAPGAGRPRPGSADLAAPGDPVAGRLRRHPPAVGRLVHLRRPRL